MRLPQESLDAPSFLPIAELPQRDRMAIATPIHTRRLQAGLRPFLRGRFPNSRKFRDRKYFVRGQTEGAARLLHSAARWSQAGPRLSAVRIWRDTFSKLFDTCFQRKANRRLIPRFCRLAASRLRCERFPPEFESWFADRLLFAIREASRIHLPFGREGQLHPDFSIRIDICDWDSGVESFWSKWSSVREQRSP